MATLDRQDPEYLYVAMGPREAAAGALEYVEQPCATVEELAQLRMALARNGIDVLIADTAGRLHTKDNLMEELKKVRRVIGKLDETAPHEVLLVLDAGTGQNAINQTKQFNQAVALTGLALTKLDGTAKGGVIFALAKQFGLPIRYIGVGEGIDDLRPFQAQAFVQALFEERERG